VVTKSVDYKIGLHVVEKTNEEIVCKEHVIDSMPKDNGEKRFTVEEYIENSEMKEFLWKNQIVESSILPKRVYM
jgi:hypothetical protein